MLPIKWWKKKNENHNSCGSRLSYTTVRYKRVDIQARRKCFFSPTQAKNRESFSIYLSACTWEFPFDICIYIMFEHFYFVSTDFLWSICLCNVLPCLAKGICICIRQPNTPEDFQYDSIWIVEFPFIIKFVSELNFRRRKIYIIIRYNIDVHVRSYNTLRPKRKSSTVDVKWIS